MDSLTQLTLGAACGEAVLGKKIGNRAMVWGAFGGILPDFDVFAMFFMDEMGALAFHRGFMHSIVFAIIMALVLGWAAHRLYWSGFYKRRRYKAAVALFVLAFYTLLVLGIHMVFGAAVETLGWITGGIIGGAMLGLFLWSKYFISELNEVNATRRDWALLFFISIVTHPLLDCFTAFGTQLFLPFSNYRVAFNNISVADPAYTIPLLLCLLIAAFIAREKQARRMANWLGIGLSSAYMLFTFYHKSQFNKIFEQSLKEQGIVAHRYMTAPTILNNFLWIGLAEGDTAYYFGEYTFLSEEKKLPRFVVLPKNHEALAGFENDPNYRTLQWFSKGYYNIITRKDGRLQLNDLRFGSFDGSFDEDNDYIFKFILDKKDGKLEVHQSREGREVSGDAFKEFFERVKGSPKQ